MATIVSFVSSDFNFICCYMANSNTSINPIGIDKMFGLTNISQLNLSASTINDETFSLLILHSFTQPAITFGFNLFCIFSLSPLALFALLIRITC